MAFDKGDEEYDYEERLLDDDGWTSDWDGCGGYGLIGDRDRDGDIDAGDVFDFMGDFFEDGVRYETTITYGPDGSIEIVYDDLNSDNDMLVDMDASGDAILICWPA